MFGAANDRTDFFGKVVDIFAVLEAACRSSHGRGASPGVLIILEDQPMPIAVDVEAVLFDGRQFGLKLVVIHRFVAE